MLLLTAMSDSRVLLHGIRWETYERLVDDLDNPGVRLTYDDGDLEIMSPSYTHEWWKTLLGRMIETMTAELAVSIKSGGSTTFKHRDLKKGIEPDECYWVQNELRVRGKRQIDLRVDPAPDLVVESESSRSMLDRLGILAALGVGEAWRFDGERLTILVRDEHGRFGEQPCSRCFPWLPVPEFTAQLRAAEGADETAWIRRFQQWVRESVQRT